MTDKPKRPAVHVGIVNYFTSMYLEVLVHQLVGDGAQSVIIFDNSEDDAEWDRLSELADGVDVVVLLKSERNVGFGGGHNAIVRYLADVADEHILCALNPDTRIEPGCLPALADAVIEYESACVVSPVIVTGDLGEPVVWFAGGDIDLRRGAVSHKGYGNNPPPREGDVYETDFLSGAVLATTLGVWRTQGFDEELFLYWEDVDLALRWRDCGVALTVQPRARVWHAEGGSQSNSAGRHSAVYHRYMNRNRIVVLAPRTGLTRLLFGSGARGTAGQLVKPLRENGVRGSKTELRAALRGFLGGIWWAVGRTVHPAYRRRNLLPQSDIAPRRVSTTVAVFAPTATGGHPEYVHKALEGVLESGDGIEFVWPIRADLDVRFLSERFDQPIVIPSQIPRSDLVSTWRWAYERLRPWRRHDVAFCAFLLRARGVDVVLIEEIQRFTLPLVVGLSRLLGLRVVVRLHNVRRHDYTGGLFDSADEWLTGKGLRLASSVVVHTQGNRRVAVERFGLRRTAVVPHGISVVSSSETGPEGPRTFLLFGEIRANKGVDVLLKAFATYAGECSLTIAGRVGPPLRSMIAEAVRRDSRVEWIDGFVESDRVAELMSRANAVVLPYTEFEAQSGVLHLAIEHGVPVIVSDVGGLGETVNALGIGLIVPPRDAAALSDALTAMDDTMRNQAFRHGVVSAQGALEWRTVGAALSPILSGTDSSLP